MAFTFEAFMEVEGRKSPWDNPSWGVARKSPWVVVRKRPCEEARKTPLEEAFEEAYQAYVEQDRKPYRVESREGYRKEFRCHVDTIASDNKLARKAWILVPKEFDALVKPVLNTLVYRTRVKAVACVPLIQKKWFQLISSTSNVLVPPQFGNNLLAEDVSDDELCLQLQSVVEKNSAVLGKICVNSLVERLNRFNEICSKLKELETATEIFKKENDGLRANFTRLKELQVAFETQKMENNRLRYICNVLIQLEPNFDMQEKEQVRAGIQNLEF